jgi:DNA-binding Lrp family transcriptional regulator
MLIADARMSLKDIAKECNISSVSVLNRIKRLKKLGVITGATLFTKNDSLGLQITATIGMETTLNREDIMQFFTKHTYLVEPSTSVGEYDLCALVFAEDIASLNEKVELLRRRTGIRKVIVNVWTNFPYFAFDNLDVKINKKEEEK